MVVMQCSTVHILPGSSVVWQLTAATLANKTVHMKVFAESLQTNCQIKPRPLLTLPSLSPGEPCPPLDKLSSCTARTWGQIGSRSPPGSRPAGQTWGSVGRRRAGPGPGYRDPRSTPPWRAASGRVYIWSSASGSILWQPVMSPLLLQLPTSDLCYLDQLASDGTGALPAGFKWPRVTTQNKVVLTEYLAIHMVTPVRPCRHSSGPLHKMGSLTNILTTDEAGEVLERGHPHTDCHLQLKFWKWWLMFWKVPDHITGRALHTFDTRHRPCWDNRI